MSVNSKLEELEERVDSITDKRDFEKIGFMDETKNPIEFYAYKEINGIRTKVLLTKEEVNKALDDWFRRHKSPMVVIGQRDLYALVPKKASPLAISHQDISLT